MKRFWLILLSLGLVMAFSVSAFAVDVKFSGEYYAAGLYLDKASIAETSNANISTAFFTQRFRLGTDFIVSPCLKLVTRADIMERTWQPDSLATYQSSANTQDRNIDWDIAYIDYTSPIGLFRVGYMTDYSWGTIWGNRESGPTSGQIKYILPIPNTPVTIVFDYAKEAENSYWIENTSAVASDRDYDSYRLGPIFNFKNDTIGGEAGVLFIFNNTHSYRGAPLSATSYPFYQRTYVAQPYFKTNIGPVFLQGELSYAFGKRYSETSLVEDHDVSSLTAWLDGDAKLGIFSIGGSLAYVQGQDPTSDKIQNAQTGGRDWDPCLIMYNNTVLNSWAGPVAGYSSESIDGEMTNAWFAQVRGSVTPIPQFTAGMSLSYARADQDMGGDKEKGWEVDVTGTYKITNNLSYMLGFGYYKAGDFYKAAVDSNNLSDDYLLINRLTLSF